MSERDSDSAPPRAPDAGVTPPPPEAGTTSTPPDAGTASPAVRGDPAGRAASALRITYPDLPITERRQDLLDAIRDHQVVIVAGETGSGKSTQLPKLCLELGRGVNSLIGHTQPRRLAARTIAARVASELGVELGREVGYAVRFNDRMSRDTRVKVMTDGILLNEITRDRRLRRYDTIIVDEAHERSLNIDYLLGYLTRLLPERPDLKLIVTSATIDTERFAAHFAKAARTTVIEVSGRSYPVEVRYRPFGGDAEPDDSDAPEPPQRKGGRAPVSTRAVDERDQVQAIGDAVDELCREGTGDILVFLSGEREIRDAHDGLRDLASLRGFDIVPLYARLSLPEQQRVFEPHTRRRVVLATNVAETSLTVPGIRYVIDTGVARISRYSRRLKVQRLPIEKISQASANQRAGRCGRLGPGIALRLYAEDDFADRGEFTEPEILRTNLASVILSMRALGIGEVETFPFIEPPDRRSIRDGIELLTELNALDAEGTLTPVGRRLARLPLDPRLGRMLLEADRLGTVRDVLVIAAGLSIQDVRERPQEQREAAEALHRRFADEHSDFVAMLNLWNHLRAEQSARSGNQFRKMCRSEFLNHLRVREWQDLVSQLRQVLRDLDISADKGGAHPDRIHQALLSGLLSHVGSSEEADRSAPTRRRDPKDPKAVPRQGRQEYVGVRSMRFAIAPGSVLASKGGKWVMCGEMVETNRLWGRVAARIKPEWIEQIGAHLCTHTISEVRWDERRGEAVTTQTTLMKGLTVVRGRTVAVARFKPDLANELFVRHALVEGDWQARHAFVAANRATREAVADLVTRTRRADLVIGDGDLETWFASRVPDDAVSAASFDRWWRKHSPKTPGLLTLSAADLVREEAGSLDLATAYPSTWSLPGDVSVQLSYVFDPMDDADGLTVHVPLVVLNRLRAEQFTWVIPGWRHELVTELIRSLPKALRRELVPAGDSARALLDRRPELLRACPEGNAAIRIAELLSNQVGTVIGAQSFDLSVLPRHLRPRFVIEQGGKAIASGRDLRRLQGDLADRARLALVGAFGSIERAEVSAWDFGALPRVVTASAGGSELRGYPALVDEAGRVALRVLLSQQAQEHAMWEGTARLVGVALIDLCRATVKELLSKRAVALALARHGDAQGMAADCVDATIEHLVIVKGGPAWDDAAFASLCRAIAGDLRGMARDAASEAAEVIERHDEIFDRLHGLTAPVYDDAVVDITRQVERLVPHGFVRVVGVAGLADRVRYLTAILRRIDKLPESPAKDSEKMRRMQRLEAISAASPSAVRLRADHLLDELRVSVFAQSLGTSEPVSEERILRVFRG